MNLLEVIAKAKAERDFNILVEVMPYARFLGLSAEEIDGEVVSKLAFDDMLIGNPVLPALHGGVVGALLEHAAIVHLMWELETAHVPKTITITVDYLRSGRPRDTFARGIITKEGRRVANVRVEAWQDDRQKPIAHALAHFLLA
jgi:uncharacterized protein (TIGR00369 family)